MKILYICTHNRCRSILAEAITNHVGGGRLQARSAGSSPAGEVHPLSLQYLAEAGIATDGLTSESWDAHEHWAPDIVVTVCDNAAGETCPLWFGKAIRAHWGLADPSIASGSEEHVATAFRQTIMRLTSRIETLASADLDNATPEDLASLFQQLGVS